MRTRLLGIIITLFALSVSMRAQITYPQVPPGAFPPGTKVAIDNLAWVYGGHSFTLDVYSGAFTFRTKNEGDFSGTATVVWFGETDQFNPYFIAPNAKSVISFSFQTASIRSASSVSSRQIRKGLRMSRGGVTIDAFGAQDFVVYGFLDICTQTGEVSLGRLDGAYNIANSVIHDQCTVVPPPPPAQHFRCVGQAGNSIRINSNTGEFQLFLDGQFRVAGVLGTVFQQDGLSLLRSPGVDNDVTVLVNGGVAQVMILSHGELLRQFAGTIADCQ